MSRYRRNESSISPEETQRLHQSHVAVVGCGGLGGYIMEQLVRLGILHLTIIDFDEIEESNLNRQLVALEHNLGQKKAEAAYERICSVNSEVSVLVHAKRLTRENAKELLRDCELVFDAVDNIPTRLLLETVCEELTIPFIHGAIAGWYGQVMTVLPGDKTLSALYSGAPEKGVETELGNPAFIPGLIASLQVAEGIKVLLGKGELLQKTLLCVDLLLQQFDSIKL